MAGNCQVLKTDLDPGSTSPTDSMWLAHCGDVEGTVAALIANPQTWVQDVFGDIGILGPQRDVVTILFAHPVEISDANGIDVELVNGTNIITVRRPLGLVLGLGILDEHAEAVSPIRLNVKLHGGLAFCHYHIPAATDTDGRAPIDDVLAAIQFAILHPDAVIGNLNDPTQFSPVCTKVTQDEGGVQEVDVDPADVKFLDISPSLRFIYQWYQTNPPDLLTVEPCVKPTGTYPPTGPYNITVDTIYFVKY